jgi:hypothetical protein
MKRFGRHFHDCLPLSRVDIVYLLLPQGQVYLRYMKNATFFRHFLAHFPYILANKLEGLTEKTSEEWEKSPWLCYAILCESPFRSRRLIA